MWVKILTIIFQCSTDFYCFCCLVKAHIVTVSPWSWVRAASLSCHNTVCSRLRHALVTKPDPLILGVSSEGKQEQHYIGDNFGEICFFLKLKCLQMSILSLLILEHISPLFRHYLSQPLTTAVPEVFFPPFRTLYASSHRNNRMRPWTTWVGRKVLFGGKRSYLWLFNIFSVGFLFRASSYTH